MSEQSRKRMSLEKLTAPVVYEHLKAKKIIDNLHKNFLAQIKETPSYKRMKEVAIMHMTDILSDPSKTVPCPEDRVEKKKQIAEIGLLALSIDSSMCQIVAENLGKRAESIVNNALKELMGEGVKKQTKNLTKMKKNPAFARENCNNKIVPEYNKEAYNKSIHAILESDNESNISNNSVSVSSVHTSDLSSFDDEIELSDKEGRTIPKKIPVKFAGKLVENSKFPNIGQEKEMEEQTEFCDSETFSPSKRLKPETPDDNSRRMLSKRIRKPNSKYASADMLLLDSVQKGQKELLDVQRDLNIINGTNAKLSKGESSKSAMNRKRKAN